MCRSRQISTLLSRKVFSNKPQLHHHRRPYVPLWCKELGEVKAPPPPPPPLEIQVKLHSFFKKKDFGFWNLSLPWNVKWHFLGWAWIFPWNCRSHAQVNHWQLCKLVRILVAFTLVNKINVIFLFKLQVYKLIKTLIVLLFSEIIIC